MLSRLTYAMFANMYRMVTVEMASGAASLRVRGASRTSVKTYSRRQTLILLGFGELTNIVGVLPTAVRITDLEQGDGIACGLARLARIRVTD